MLLQIFEDNSTTAVGIYDKKIMNTCAEDELIHVYFLNVYFQLPFFIELKTIKVHIIR